MKDSKQVRSEHQSFVESYHDISKKSTVEADANKKKTAMKKPKGKECECDEKMESVIVRKTNAFTEQAEKFQMSVKQFARFVEANQHLFDIPTRQKAQLANKFQGFRESSDWDQYFGDLQELTTKETKAGTKYKVRVKEKETGSSYTRFATREKMAQLRSDPKIASVEMSDQGEAPEEKGERIAKERGGGMKKKKKKKGLDPVGRENSDVDNDGDTDSSDKYLMKRRAAIGAAMKKRNVRTEGFSDWRNDLREVIGNETPKKTKATENDPVAQPGVNNKIVVNPPMGEEVRLISAEQVETQTQIKPLPGSGKKGVTNAPSAPKLPPPGSGTKREPKVGHGTPGYKYGAMESVESKDQNLDEIAPAIAAGAALGIGAGGAAIINKLMQQKKAGEQGKPQPGIVGNLQKRNQMLQQLQNQSYQPEGEVLDEKKLTKPEMKKKEEIVKSMKKDKKGFEARYPGRGKEVMYATATKLAKKKA